MAFHPDTAFHYLEQAALAGRLGHSFLISGPARSGKTLLARRLAGFVNRVEPEVAFSGQDITVIAPESKSRRITIDRIRDLEQMLQLRSSSAGRRKVGVIMEADRMNPQASNAFLKTLEEPPADSLLLLLTSQPEQLLETILSRCTRIQLIGAGPRDLPPEEKQLVALLASFFRKGESGLPAIFGLARDFESILAGIKEQVKERYDAEQKEEVKKYKDVTDGKWLESREEQWKALADSDYLNRRLALTDVLIQWWADVLRVGRGGADPVLLECANNIRELAAKAEPGQIFKRLEALEQLRENFDRSVQESLAIEVAFLVAFGNKA